MIVLFWSRATRNLLRSFGSGIAALHRENAATKLPFLAARPIASIGPAEKETALGRGPAADHCRLERRPVLASSGGRDVHWYCEVAAIMAPA